MESLPVDGLMCVLGGHWKVGTVKLDVQLKKPENSRKGWEGSKGGRKDSKLGCGTSAWGPKKGTETEKGYRIPAEEKKNMT